jgi:hypothetical protein
MAVPRRILLRVGDEQLPAQVLHVEGRVSVRQVRVGERSAERGPLELAVDHVDMAVMEIGGVEEVGVADVSGGQTGVDRSIGR